MSFCQTLSLLAVAAPMGRPRRLPSSVRRWRAKVVDDVAHLLAEVPGSSLPTVAEVPHPLGIAGSASRSGSSARARMAVPIAIPALALTTAEWPDSL
jgi:hypothetical protein